VWIDTGDGRLFVDVVGSGPPILFLHGWSLDHRMFDPQASGLCDSFRVIRCDRRGFGRSTAPPDPARETGDVERILDALEIGSAHLLGMSQGGRVALRCAVTRPKRLRSLILQGAAIDGFDAGERNDERVPMEEYAALAREGRLDDVRRRWLSHPLMRLAPGQSAAGALLARIVGDYGGADLGVSMPRQAEVDVLSALADFRLPTLLLTGEDEAAARRRHAAEILRRVSGSREIVLPGAGHFCNLEDVASYNRALADFCGAVETGRSGS